MNTITSFLSQDHRRCDELFTQAGDAVVAHDWETASRLYGRFQHALERHMEWEEELLFPEIECRSGAALGPTRVMRAEHAQLRELLEQLAAAQRQQDREGYLELAQSLHSMLRQHNLKEEQILYPLSDNLLGDVSSGVLEHMAASR